MLYLSLFPSHGIILSSYPRANNGLIYKGITSYEDLQKTVIVETDMRAHMNPLRMKSIEALGFS